VTSRCRPIETAPVYPSLLLKKGVARRLAGGHAWIFANELAQAPGHIGLLPGTLVHVCDPTGADLGTGYFHPNTLIAVRRLSTHQVPEIGVEFLSERLRACWHLRERLQRGRYMRVVFGEADGLPGLILDRYDEVWVGQLGSAGMQALEPVLTEAIRVTFAPKALLWKSDGSGRALEALTDRVHWALGEPVAWQVEEQSLRFQVSLDAAQKTGWFYDQRDNRDRVFDLLAQALNGGQALDVCSYIGGWSLRALQAGAASVTAIDSAASALAALMQSARSNGFEAHVECLHAPAFDAMKQLAEQGRRFRLVMIDPPAFIKRKKDHAAGIAAYERWFTMALKLVEPGGFMVACSCSHHFKREELVAAVAQAAARLKRNARILAQLSQAADHPIHPAMPETEYLKGVLITVD